MFSSFSSFVFDNPSLCHCISILNSSCISPSPVTRRLPSLLSLISGLPVTVFGCLHLLVCHLQFPFLPMCLHFLNANCAALSIGPVYAFGKWLSVWVLLAPKLQCVLMLQLEGACAGTEVLTTLLFSYNPCCMELLYLIRFVAIITLPELLPKSINPLCQSSLLLCNRTWDIF